MSSNEIDLLLSEQLIGAVADRDLSDSPHGLDPTHPFSWESIHQDPKGDHGITECRGYVVTYTPSTPLFHSPLPSLRSYDRISVARGTRQ